MNKNCTHVRALRIRRANWSVWAAQQPPPSQFHLPLLLVKHQIFHQIIRQRRDISSDIVTSDQRSSLELAGQISSLPTSPFKNFLRYGHFHSLNRSTVRAIQDLHLCVTEKKLTFSMFVHCSKTRKGTKWTERPPRSFTALLHCMEANNERRNMYSKMRESILKLS